MRPTELGPRDFLLKRQENNEGVKECGWLECVQLSYLPFRQLSVGGHKTHLWKCVCSLDISIVVRSHCTIALQVEKVIPELSREGGGGGVHKSAISALRKLR